MPRVETVVSENPAVSLPGNESAENQALSPAGDSPFVLLRPEQIRIDPVHVHAARPGPETADSEASLSELAKDLRELGQIVPVIVERRADGYWLIDGYRRWKAALTLDTDEQPFSLACAVVTGDVDPLRLAIHANLKRKGLSHVQFAHLCAELRKLNSWEGTKEVAAYLGVSRAQVSQHDKLLAPPEGMDTDAYDRLLAQVASGEVGAEAAFYTLSHVKPEKAGKVLERAAEIAEAESPSQPLESAAEPPSTPDSPSEAPARANARRGASQQATSKPSDRVKTPEWMKQEQRKHKERVAAEKKAKVETRHVKQAAKEEKAERATGKTLQRGVPDLRRIYDQMKSPAYPDIMRNFVTVLSEQWWRGDAGDKEVLGHWNQIAQLVEAQLEKTAHLVHKPAAKVTKAVKKTAKASKQARRNAALSKAKAKPAPKKPTAKKKTARK